MRDHAHTLSDFRVPTLSIVCEPCGRFERYNVAKLMEKYGDAKLPEPRHVLANCMGRFSDAVAGLRADLNKSAMSSEHAMRGYKAAMDAALGRGSQALTEWIEGLR
jgi:hypothetical protein